MTPPSTFPQALTTALRTDPGRPFVTFYDLATGERVELSLATYANWVAKASSLLLDEHGLERGQSLRIDLPPHWLSLVFLGAAWNGGLVVTDSDAPEAVVCGPDEVAAWSEYAAGPVLACSLLPLGVRFADPLPPGVHDVGLEIWGQPDGFTPWDPPEPGDTALRASDNTALRASDNTALRASDNTALLRGAGWETTQEQLWAAAGPSWGPAGSRLWSEADPASLSGSVSLAGPLMSGGSLVLVAHADAADAARREAIAASERVTGRFPPARDEA